MSEAWVMELLTGVRDAARSNGMYRLAEHIDDAMLVAASEFHEALADEVATGYKAEHERAGAEALRGVAAARLH